MSDEGRVQQLLDEMLDRERTPEEVCSGDPELLPEVRARWARVRRVAEQLDDLFPSSDSLTSLAPAPDENALPQVAGYEVGAVLGVGGMGVVFRARQLKPNRPVALKMLLAGRYAGSQERARFLREVEAAGTLRHPNIVQLYAAGDHDGRPYFTMEFVEGGTLAQHLARGRPDPRRAAELVAALAVPVQFAHKSGIVHRDLKPANILLTAPVADGQPWGTPKIADFGLARFIGSGPDLTHTGARLGTPNYMAPEQALGRAAEIGPATDIYALGAILYEALTGRPPFDGTSAVETERRVVSEEPAPPSRANARVPRDLETVCLKCLHKSAARRYASAQDLADDLHRYLDGKPVLARPVGLGERTVKWARRRPAAALFIAALLSLAGASVGTGAWLQQQQAGRRAEKAHQRGQAQDAVSTALSRVGALRRQEQWRNAKLILTEASAHLAAAESPELEEQFRQAEADTDFAAGLDRARENLFHLYPTSPDGPQRAAEYQRLFDQAGLSPGDDSAPLVARIRDSAIRPQIVAALDDWAYVMHKLGNDTRATQLLHLARSVDPGSDWHTRFRDTKVWAQQDQLRRLADTAFTTSPLPSERQLALLGLLLREFSGGRRNTQLLTQACRRYPSSFWLNREMGDATFADGRTHEAVGFYRAALAVRPDSAKVYNKLSHALLPLGQTEEALAARRRAAELDAADQYRAQLVQDLAVLGYWKEAAAECQKAQEADPSDPTAFDNLAHALDWHGRTGEAAVLFRKAAEIGPTHSRTQTSYGEFLVRLNRHSEAVEPFRKALAADPKQTRVRQCLARALAASGQPDQALAEYQKLFDPVYTFPCSEEYTALLRTQGKWDEAGAHLRAAVKSTPLHVQLWNALAGVALDQGNFAEARDATEGALAQPAAVHYPGLRKQLEFCRVLHAVESKLPAILAGQEKPPDALTQLAIAEWCFGHKRRTATAADFYTSAFAADPSLADGTDTSTRFPAARAAALAGCGVGADASALGDQRRAELRKRALDWLTAEYRAWADSHSEAKPGARAVAPSALRDWLENRDLAVVRDEPALAKLPPDERRAWQELWSKVRALVEQDPAAKIARAQSHAAQREWKKAAECYSAAFALEPTDDGNLWFEYAACQLLAGDRAGYCRSCAHMIARQRANPRVRAYLVARACTLAPDSITDLDELARTARPELFQHGTKFWALTEQGALLLRRDKLAGAAMPRLEESLLIDDRPGRAVLNWLWLAVAHQQSNNPDEARRWLTKATEWLDQQEGNMPRESLDMGSHLHNWLEAHVLRREVESVLTPAPKGLN